GLDETALARVSHELKALPAPKGVVLDLRGCSQGAIADGARLAELFLESGTLLRVYGKTGEALVRGTLSSLTPVRTGNAPAPTPAPKPGHETTPAATDTPAPAATG